jgi:hypothetical protein
MATTTATMSGTQFDALPHDKGRRWELLAGEVIEMPSRRGDTRSSSTGY